MQRLRWALPLLLCVAGNAAAQAVSSDPLASTLEQSATAAAAFRSAWGLSDREHARFERELRLMQPFVDTQISPLEVLGIAAQSESERRLYASRYVEVQREHNMRALRWAIHVEQAALNAGLREALESDPLIQGRLNSEDKRLQGERKAYFGTKLPAKQSAGHDPLSTDHWPKNQQVPGRIVVFVAPDCAACDDAFEGARRSVKTGLADAVDVVFADMGAPDRDVITRWAVDNGIEADDVSERRITLNYESTRWKTLRGERGVPVVVGQ